MKKILFHLLLIIFLAAFTTSQSTAQNTITLRKSFVDSFKNRITITAQYDVWFTHHRANPPAKDGDIHAAGYDDKIGMPTVAEIMNAKEKQNGIDLFISHEGKGKPNNPKFEVIGVWRLWPEHMGGGVTFFQGMKLSLATIKKKTTNPAHVFEIHPLTSVGNIDVSDAIHNVKGLTPKNAKLAFTKIQKKTCTVSSTTKTISFETTQIGLNYINMWIRIDSRSEVKDGAFANCTVLNSNFKPNSSDVKKSTVSAKTRIAFVKDSEAFTTLMQKGIGDFMHILGTPRVSLEILSDAADQPALIKGKLPFEIIAAGNIK